MAKKKSSKDALKEEIERAIDEGWANQMPEPADEDYENLDQPPRDKTDAKHLNAYDREVRYGTPLEEYHLTEGAHRMEEERQIHHSVNPLLSGGDIDAAWQEAEENGEESVGGTVATPDQDQVDQLGRAVGVEFQANQELRGSAEIMEKRDRNRWELDRRSADDASPDFPRRPKEPLP